MNTQALLILATLLLVACNAPPPSEQVEKSKATTVTETVKEKVVDAKDAVKDKAVDVKTTVVDTTTTVKDKVVGKVHTEASLDVRRAQTALRDKGYTPGKIDGIHGKQTTAALRAYQKAEGLKVNGRLDDPTKARLLGNTSPGPTK
jgi:peptidoglycan hydrolase-like protein with peptidoglycan-binding domain